MPKFNYISRNAEGERVTAVAEAESRQGLVTALKNQGLTVVEVREFGAAGAVSAVGFYSQLKKILQMNITPARIGTADLAIFWRQFATMISAGRPVFGNPGTNPPPPLNISIQKKPL